MNPGERNAMPLVFGEGNGPRDEYPKVFERNVNIQITDVGSSQFHVRASLFDVEHNFHAELVVDVPSGRIEDVKISMTRRPYPTLCPRALENAQKLKGMTIGPGITRRIIEALGRSEGCVHMVELFAAAAGFVATILIGRRSGLTDEVAYSEEEHRQKWMPILKNSCQVFRTETVEGTQKS
jgi:hypothetical protein